MAVDPDLLTLWCSTWARSRRVEAPRRHGSAIRISAGPAEQSERFVFAALVADEIRSVAERASDDHVLIKVCASRDDVRAVLPPGWTLGDARFSMTTSIKDVAVPTAAAGYSFSLRREDWGWSAEAADAEGEVIGRLGLLIEGRTAVLDRLMVDETHRGRGLATALIMFMHKQAIAAGATSGALVATAAGRPLYERCGWQVVSDYTTAERVC